MNKRMKTLTLAFLFGLSVPMAAHAHRTWLLPSAATFDDTGALVTLDASSAEDAFDLGMAQPLDTLVVIGPDGKPVQPDNIYGGKQRSSAEITLKQEGTYRASVVRENVFASYKLNGEIKRWRGDKQDLATAIPPGAQEVQVTRMQARQETFMTAGKPGDTVLKLTSGIGIELVPLTSPTGLFVGDTSRFRVLLDGKPLSNFLFGIVPGGTRYRGVLNEINVQTDANGEFSVKWPAAGVYLLGINWPARVAGAPPASRRLSYSATFEVLPE